MKCQERNYRDDASCLPILSSYEAVSIPSTMKSVALVVSPSLHTSNRRSYSLINILHLDLILLLMDALIRDERREKSFYFFFVTDAKIVKSFNDA